MSTHYKVETGLTKGTLRRYVRVTHEFDPERPDESFSVYGHTYRLVRSHGAAHFRRSDGLITIRCPVMEESMVMSHVPAFCPVCGAEVVR